MQDTENKTEYQVIELMQLLPICKDIIKQYCIENEIDNEKEIHPSTWSDILDTINERLITDGRILKTETNRYNQYDLDSVIYLYNKVYVKLCNIYIQEINQKDFLILSGIDKQSLYNWSSNSNSNSLSTKSFDFIGKINEDNEASVWKLMLADRGNPNKYFGKLNRYHGWNGSGTVAEKKAIATRTPEQIAAEYGQTGPQIAQKPLELPDV